MHGSLGLNYLRFGIRYVLVSL